MKDVTLKLSVLAGMLLGLPMVGVFLVGSPVSDYLAFPPETRYVTHAPFSRVAFGLFSLIIIAAVLPLLVRLQRVRPSLGAPPLAAPFPWWGWAGILLGLMAWIMAWSRFQWFTALQPHTFTPLWFSFIIIINALTFRRTRHCMMVDHPGVFISLFPVSAAFWWFFEYLNRYVQNWHYVGVSFGPWAYFWFATLPFATVLPAVLSTRGWITTLFRLQNGLQGPRLPAIFGSRPLAWGLLVLSGIGLAGIGVWPDYLFPLLWVSPLLIIICLQSLVGTSPILTDVLAGEWGRVVSSGLAALFCGLFWEMWNFFSLAKWEYSIPFVHQFLVFEMPVLGYAGYLPFGIECVVIGQFVEQLPTRHIGTYQGRLQGKSERAED